MRRSGDVSLRSEVFIVLVPTSTAFTESIHFHLHLATNGAKYDFQHLRDDAGLEEMLGHEIPSPEAARRFLKQFHSEKKIEQARQQRKPKQIAFILEEANALAGLQIDSRFRLDSDGPDEAQQFASYGGDDLRWSLPAATSRA